MAEILVWYEVCQNAPAMDDGKGAAAFQSTRKIILDGKNWGNRVLLLRRTCMKRNRPFKQILGWLRRLRMRQVRSRTYPYNRRLG